MARKKTSELTIGDVVRTHGMRVKLDREPIRFDAGPVATATTGNPDAYSYSGLVLNEEEIGDAFLARSIHWRASSGDWHEEPRWTVQGNDLVTWDTEPGS